LFQGALGDPPIRHLVVEHVEADAADECFEAGLGVVPGGRDSLFGSGDDAFVVEAGVGRFPPEVLGRGEVTVGGGDGDERPFCPADRRSSFRWDVDLLARILGWAGIAGRLDARVEPDRYDGKRLVGGTLRLTPVGRWWLAGR
jgi:hypothetical protein